MTELLKAVGKVFSCNGQYLRVLYDEIVVGIPRETCVSASTLELLAIDYKNKFNMDMPTAKEWIDADGLSLSSYIEPTYNNITTEDIGQGKHITIYEKLEINNDSQNILLSSILDKINKLYESTADSSMALNKISEVLDNLVPTENKEELNSNEEDTTEEDSKYRYTALNFTEDILGNWIYERDIYYKWRQKKNLIIKGSTGIGKSTIMDKAAMVMVGTSNINTDRILSLSFNPNTDRSEIIDGYIVRNGSNILKKGRLLKFIDRAIKHEAEGIPYVVKIDELSRCNVESVLGEFMTASAKRESDDNRNVPYTQREYVSTYYGTKFRIPSNLYIICTMNSYDTLTQILGDALRNRFAIIDMNSDRMLRMHKVTAEMIIRDKEKHDIHMSNMCKQLFKMLMESLDKINDNLAKDKARGRDNIVGMRAFFNKFSKPGELKSIWSSVELDIIEKSRILDVSIQDSIKTEIDKINNLIFHGIMEV